MEKELIEIKNKLIKRVFRLGPASVAVYIPTDNYPAINYLCDEDPGETDYDYELVLYDLQFDNANKYSDYIHLADNSFRGKRFQGGFYLTHHFGGKTHKITRGKTQFVIGSDISKVLWTYYVKFFLSDYAILNNCLHLKAAAVADASNNVTIIVGRGSGGKSVLLNKLVDSGYKFLANTHILIKDGRVLGVNTAIRFRNDPYFRKYIKNGMAKKHIEEGEYIIAPNQIYDEVINEGNLKNIIITNYGVGEEGIFKVDKEYSTNVLRNFSYPLHTYGMKDDYLEIVEGNLASYNKIYFDDMNRISEITENAKNIYCNFNIENHRDFEKLLNMLG